MAEKNFDPSEELSQKIEQCLRIQELHKKVTLANDYRKGLNVRSVQNGSTAIKLCLINVKENTAIWHALIVNGTHCSINQTLK